MPAPLPIQEIFLKALLVPWHQRGALLRTLLLPALGWVLLSRLGQDWVQESWIRAIPIWIVWGVLYTFFAVTCHRLVLLGERAVPHFGLMQFTRRELRFLLLLALIYIVYMFVMLVGGTVLGSVAINVLPNGSERVPKYISVAFVWMSFAVSGFVFARFGVVLPATALDKKHGLKWAWQLSHGNGLRLFFLVGLIPYALSYLMSLIDLGAGSIPSFLYSVLWFILLIIEIAALSLSYQALTAGGEVQ